MGELLVSQLAQQALLYEVTCLAKPGLVDPVDAGSHQDMDVFTFIQSSVALGPHLQKFVSLGVTYENESAATLFTALRAEGLLAESAMLQATNGVNTHKGAIFSLALFLGACGKKRVWEQPITLSELIAVVQEMTHDLLVDFEDCGAKATEVQTWGERLYLQTGKTGIRGEAVAGYPSIVTAGLPFYQAHQGTQQEKMIDTLLYLAKYVDDTNLIKRSGDVVIKEKIQPMIESFFAFGGSGTNEGRILLRFFNQWFTRENWSLGGTADALIVTIFLDLLCTHNFLMND